MYFVHLTRLRKKPIPDLPENIQYFMAKQLSTTFFILSMIIILLAGTGFFAALHFFVNPLQNPTTASSYQPVTSLPVSLTLNLSSPEDNSLVFDNNLLVSGKTIPNALILITINDNNQFINASNIGDFSLTIKLQLGGNQLIVSSFDNLGNYKSELRTIYYSGEKL